MSLFNEKLLREIIAEEVRRVLREELAEWESRHAGQSTYRSRRRPLGRPSHRQPSEFGWRREGLAGITPGASCGFWRPSWTP